MQKVPLITALAAFSAGLALASGPAHALTAIPFSTGPFSLPGDPAGVIPSGTFDTGGATDDFTFTTVGGTYKTLMQMQSSDFTGTPQFISFDLFKGSPGGGVFVASSGGTPTAPTLLTLVKGTYYLQVTPPSAQPKQLVTGGLLLEARAPEPGVWAMMLIGFGALGASLRARRSGATAAA
jgi:hypothetical protein